MPTPARRGPERVEVEEGRDGSRARATSSGDDTPRPWSAVIDRGAREREDTEARGQAETSAAVGPSGSSTGEHFRARCPRASPGSAAGAGGGAALGRGPALAGVLAEEACRL